MAIATKTIGGATYYNAGSTSTSGLPIWSTTASGALAAAKTAPAPAKSATGSKLMQGVTGSDTGVAKATPTGTPTPVVRPTTPKPADGVTADGSRYTWVASGSKWVRKITSTRAPTPEEAARPPKPADGPDYVWSWGAGIYGDKWIKVYPSPTSPKPADVPGYTWAWAPLEGKWKQTPKLVSEGGPATPGRDVPLTPDPTTPTTEVVDTGEGGGEEIVPAGPDPLTVEIRDMFREWLEWSKLPGEPQLPQRPVEYAPEKPERPEADYSYGAAQASGQSAMLQMLMSLVGSMGGGGQGAPNYARLGT